MRINVLEVSREADSKVDEFVRKYREGRRDEAIQGVYEKHRNLFFQTSKDYYGLDDHTIESSIYEQIWKALDDYDENKSTCKLTTMICKYIRNDLRALTQANSYNKRKINDATNCSFFSEFEQDEDRLHEAGDEVDYSLIEMRMYINSKDLTSNQLKYCTSIIENVSGTKMADVAEHIGVSRAGALQIKKALKSKLNDLVTI